MKIAVLLAMCVLFCPVTLRAQGKISYSGIPCKWACTHETIDDIRPQRDDEHAARQDRELQRRLVNSVPFPAAVPGAACFVDRVDGRLLLLDPLVTQGR